MCEPFFGNLICWPSIAIQPFSRCSFRNSSWVKGWWQCLHICFGFSLLDYVNDLFFNEELESETSDDEDLSDGESVGSYEWNYWIVAIII